MDRTNSEPVGGPISVDAGFAPYLAAIRRHRVLVVAVTLTAVAASLVWLAFHSRNYEATAQVLVSPVSRDDSAFVGLPVPRTAPGDETRVVQTAAALLDSEAAAATAARRLGGDWSAARVADAVRVQPVGQTSVLAVTARASGARLAARVANAFTVSALEVRATAVGGEVDRLIAELRSQPDPASAQRRDRLEAARVSLERTLSQLQPARLPARRVGAGPLAIVALSLLAGFVLGMAAALVADAWRRPGVESEPAGDPEPASAPVAVALSEGGVSELPSK